MRFLYLFFFIFILQYSYSQELPPVVNFSAKDYEAGNQNWMIVQDENQHIYIANNSGLLQYNGEQWNLNKLPEGSFIRSVAMADGKVFTGAYMDFGYWEKDNTGKLNYQSLKNLVEEDFIDGEQFWHIEAVNDYVVFQSLSRLYSYNVKTNKVVIIPANYTITNLFQLQQKIYYQVAEEGLYVIDNGQQKIFVPNTELNNQIVVGFFEFENEKFLVTRNNRIYSIIDGKLTLQELENLELSEDESIFIAKLITDQILALGTIGNGLKLYNLKTEQITHFKQPSILNNTVLSLFNDKQGNLWSGLDNGISLLNLNSSLKIFTDTFGEVGTVYCSYQEANIRYLGTNQGLYARNVDEKGDYKLIPNTSGQVWSIQKIYEKLLVGHDKGTFLIEGFTANSIFNETGTWEIKPYNGGFLQGHYNGMSFAEYSNDKIGQFQRFKNYDLSSRNILIDSLKDEVWVGHDHKGIFKTRLSLSENSVEIINNYNLPTQEGTGLTLFSFNQKLFASTAKKFYKFNSSEDDFELATSLNTIFKNEKRITGITKVIENSLWCFGDEQVYRITKDAFQDDYVLNKYDIPNNLRGISTSFENISIINANTYLIGSNLGYITFELPVKGLEVAELKINSVRFSGKDQKLSNLNLAADDNEITYRNNLIEFNYSLPQHNLPSDVKYSYRLLGYEDSWSSWSTASAVSFKNLSHGEYKFEVRALLNEHITSTKSFSFSVKKPWYISTIAIVFYILLFLLILFITHKLYNNYYKKEQERIIIENKEKLKLQEITAQQEIVTLKNKQLETEVESKNRELAASTMNIIRKNEFLTELKQKLANANTDQEIQEVISIINRNIAEKDNWKLFKEAFDNADKDFLQSVKEKHPNLTSNDLKLCAYLRLNLSSKEIAPMLNISVRSVEIKRYRLRKKMDLAHEQGLVEYILTF
ncbi:triple tyrosine motif-containing protein [Mesonia sp.]|uniref:helix-turn-helix and ligand-binding sensor domain-containing protein n=1 Tax=Mesonia sp. TaxID=1960830 RepID=UPI0017744DBF|nr:triple tyrosine motif-containing protein [Mesonia sp.]HIB37101.1 hypothetical protein [Mesonia sp.]HIO26698.1 hypothetical protein [Flavobacteriaceae bacterium]